MIPNPITLLFDQVTSKACHALVGFLASCFLEILAFFSEEFLISFTPSIYNFLEIFGYNGPQNGDFHMTWATATLNNSDAIINFFAFFALLGYVIATVIFVVTAFSMAFAEYIDVKDSPKTLIMRYLASIMMITFSTDIINLFFGITGKLWDVLIGIDNPMINQERDLAEAFVDNFSTIASWDADDFTISTISPVAFLLIALVCGVLFLVEYIKYLIEIIERFLVTGVLYMSFPAIAGSFVSKKTDMLGSYFKMLVSQLLLLLFNLLFLNMILMAVRTGVSPTTPTRTHVQEVDLILGFLIALGVTRVAQRIDSYMNSLGLNAAHTSGNLLDAFTRGVTGLVSTASHAMRIAGQAQRMSTAKNMKDYNNNLGSKNAAGVAAAGQSLNKTAKEMARDAANKGALDNSMAQMLNNADPDLTKNYKDPMGRELFNSLPDDEKKKVLNGMMKDNMKDMLGNDIKNIKATADGITADVLNGQGKLMAQNDGKTDIFDKNGKSMTASDMLHHMKPSDFNSLPDDKKTSLLKNAAPELFTGENSPISKLGNGNISDIQKRSDGSYSMNLNRPDGTSIPLNMSNGIRDGAIGSTENGMSLSFADSRGNAAPRLQGKDAAKTFSNPDAKYTGGNMIDFESAIGRTRDSIAAELGISSDDIQGYRRTEDGAGFEVLGANNDVLGKEFTDNKGVVHGLAPITNAASPELTSEVTTPVPGTDVNGGVSALESQSFNAAAENSMSLDGQSVNSNVGTVGMEESPSLGSSVNDSASFGGLSETSDIGGADTSESPSFGGSVNDNASFGEPSGISDAGSVGVSESPSFGGSVNDNASFGEPSGISDAGSVGVSESPSFGGSVNDSASFSNQSGVSDAGGVGTTESPSFGGSVNDNASFGEPSGISDAGSVGASASPSFGGSVNDSTSFSSQPGVSDADGVGATESPSFGGSVNDSTSFSGQSGVSDAGGAGTTESLSFGGSTNDKASFASQPEISDAGRVGETESPSFGNSGEAGSSFTGHSTMHFDSSYDSHDAGSPGMPADSNNSYNETPSVRFDGIPEKQEADPLSAVNNTNYSAGSSAMISGGSNPAADNTGSMSTSNNGSYSYGDNTTPSSNENYSNQGSDPLSANAQNNNSMPGNSGHTFTGYNSMGYDTAQSEAPSGGPSFNRQASRPAENNAADYRPGMSTPSINTQTGNNPTQYTPPQGASYVQQPSSNSATSIGMGEKPAPVNTPGSSQNAVHTTNTQKEVRITESKTETRTQMTSGGVTGTTQNTGMNANTIRRRMETNNNLGQTGYQNNRNNENNVMKPATNKAKNTDSKKPRFKIKRKNK